MKTTKIKIKNEAAALLLQKVFGFDLVKVEYIFNCDVLSTFTVVIIPFAISRRKFQKDTGIKCSIYKSMGCIETPMLKIKKMKLPSKKGFNENKRHFKALLNCLL
jgi:hypothetical protein